MLSRSGQTGYKPRRVATIPRLPDKVLVDCLVDKGEVPRRIAEQWMHVPEMIISAQTFYVDVADAERGDKEAKERLDYFREQMDFMKQAEKALGNDPEVQVTPFKLPNGQEVIMEGDTVRTGPAKLIQPL